MSERVVTGYRRLFEIRILHHYWLDEGATIFDLIASQSLRETRLLSYDIRSFVALTPTAGTLQTLAGLGGVYKNTALGGLAAVPEGAVVPADTLFELVVTVTSSAFFNYTALTLPPRKIYELYHQPDDKTYRYKENVAVLSNLTGAARAAPAGKTLFLSAEIPAPGADDRVESLILAGAALRQLTSDQPAAASQQLSATAADLPVFVHQGDVPAIIAPAGLAGAPARGILLTDDIGDRLFALIRLSALRLDDGDFSVTDANGHAKATPPVFQIRFKNRSTTRQYFNKNTGAVAFTEPDPLPLTRFGNAGSRQKPSEDLIKAQQSGSRITRLVSQIFV